MKYITVKFQSASDDDGSDPSFSRADAEEGIEWLNYCFEPWRIEFVFDHQKIYSSYFNNIDEDWSIVYEFGRQFSIDPLRNLNIITTHFWCNWMGQRTLCGGAPYPWSGSLADRRWSVLMTPNHWQHDGLICHEVGHAFGLIHTFGEFGVEACSACYEIVGAGNRDTSGDFCSDTPPTPGDPWNDQCAPAWGTDRCSGQPWGETDYRNWMAYTPYAPCKDHFTPQQAGRAHCWIEDARSGWISYAKIEPDTDFGPAPLRIRFEGVTSLTPNGWAWDFGDGTGAHDQSPSHVYASPGVYSPTVTLGAPEGEFEATMSREVWVYDGSIAIEDVQAPPGTNQVRVPITATNSIPVDFIDLPLQWNGPANLTLESVTTTGLRSRSFPAPEWLDLDVENGRGCLRIRTFDSLAMPPGEGQLLELTFSVNPGLLFADNEIRVEDREDCRMEFVTDRGPFVPTVSNGSVKICEPPNCNGVRIIRRPSGRRRP